MQLINNKKFQYDGSCARLGLGTAMSFYRKTSGEGGR